MAEPHETVVSILDHLEKLLKRMDKFVSEIDTWAQERQEIALQIAVLRAAQDPTVLAAEADYEERLAENRPYEHARPAEDVIREAHARYGTS